MKDFSEYTFIYEELNKKFKEDNIKYEQLQIILPEPVLEYEEPEEEDLAYQSYGACKRCPESFINNGNCSEDCLLPYLYPTEFIVV